MAKRSEEERANRRDGEPNPARPHSFLQDDRLPHQLHIELEKALAQYAVEKDANFGTDKFRLIRLHHLLPALRQQHARWVGITEQTLDANS